MRPIVVQAVIAWWLVANAASATVHAVAGIGSGVALWYAGSVPLAAVSLVAGHVAALGILAAVAARVLRGEEPSPRWRSLKVAVLVGAAWVTAEVGGSFAGSVGAVLQGGWARSLEAPEAMVTWLYVLGWTRAVGAGLHVVLVTVVFAVATARARSAAG